MINNIKVIHIYVHVYFLWLKVFTDGLSNKLVGFYVQDNPEDMVIVKVYGSNTGKLIDRKAEIETMRVNKLLNNFDDCNFHLQNLKQFNRLFMSVIVVRNCMLPL